MKISTQCNAAYQAIPSLWRHPHTRYCLLIFAVAIFITLTGNYSLFSRIVRIYPAHDNLFLLLSLTLFFTLNTCLLLSVVAIGRFYHWILGLFLILAATAAFFMDTYGVIIDTVMLENILQSDRHEISALMNAEFFIRLILLGILPAVLVITLAPKFRLMWTSLRSTAIFLMACSVLIASMVIPFYSDYADFVREHRTVRFYANPTYFSYSFILFLKQKVLVSPRARMTTVASDAHRVIPQSSQTRNKLFILVVGETARADRFSLNGYHRLTNPELQQQSVVSFHNVTSCGTSTSVSVPCMFSPFKRKQFDLETNARFENVLDVLHRQGVNILWRDNNSDSKGVALRVPYEDFKSPTLNPVCDDECRDIGMLSGLDAYIQNHPHQDILIVLHQLGNHGPEYYRRVTKPFEIFTPICRESRLSQCSQHAIDNAYDNAIRYTDYFLSRTINLLKKYDDHYQTAMLYVADHGESLGEYGIYLHAAPYMIAPKEQKHVPVILWPGQHFPYQLNQLQALSNYPLTHSDLFCSLLVAYDIHTQMCDALQQKLSD